MEHYFMTSQLTVGYNGKPLVRDIEIRLPKGRILTLIGPNGSGKSTILKTIIKQLDRLGGLVYIGGRSLEDMTEKDVAQQVSVVLTQRMKTERMTCEEVVETGRYPYTGALGILSPRDHEKVLEAMELTRVADLRFRDFMRVSDGQRQRVLLARAIAQEPEILVLDEPTSFLDVKHKLELLELLRDLARNQGTAVILSLHELDLAQRVSDDVLCVNGEYITQYGPVEEIFRAEQIRTLYDLTTGSYNPLFGSLEMKRVEGAPRVFVIAGGGTGIETYRRLQKQGIPFAAGVLHENDVDYQVAKELSVSVVTECAFMPISDAAYDEAVRVMCECGRVLNCLDHYGETNLRNRVLWEYAKEHGMAGTFDESLK